MEEEFLEIDRSSEWAKIFQKIRNESLSYDFSIQEAKKPENRTRNRYRDVSPYDHNRVKLKVLSGSDYINASLIEVSSVNRRYILTQGPLPQTAGHFWQMVWEQKTKAVVMLNKVIEKNSVKCHQYWPLGTQNNGLDDMMFEDTQFKVEYIDETEVTYYTVRKLLLIHLSSGESREILHFHYTMWPDFGVPRSPAAFLNFLMAVRHSGALEDNVGPAIVHCSAGIGRSGTFCLVDSCLLLIEKTKDPNCVSILEMLLDMRKYRMGLIQTQDQLRFSYLAIIEGAKRICVGDTTFEVDEPFGDEISEDEEEEECDKSDPKLLQTNANLNHSFKEVPPPPLPPRRRLPATSTDIPAEETATPVFDLKVFTERQKQYECRKRKRQERQQALADRVGKMKEKQRVMEIHGHHRRVKRMKTHPSQD